MDSLDYKPAKALVTGKDSDAKNKCDTIFISYSKECGHELKEILQAYIDSLIRYWGKVLERLNYELKPVAINNKKMSTWCFKYFDKHCTGDNRF